MRLVRRILWIVVTLALCLLVIALIYANYKLKWTWTGFNKTLWDWMQLLIIPIVLALAAIWFNRIERKSERIIASDNQRETALQAYLDRMTELLLKEELRMSKPDDEVRNVARVRTLTILTQLDSRRRDHVFAFLRESGLISSESGKSIIGFHNAYLEKINLSETNLMKTDFSRAFLVSANFNKAFLSEANLRGANLRGANLRGARLRGADLRGANLSKVDLREANLFGAILSRANLSDSNLSRANLIGAALSRTNLSGANLFGANLLAADLSEANLTGAIITSKQLKSTIDDS